MELSENKIVMCPTCMKSWVTSRYSKESKCLTCDMTFDVTLLELVKLWTYECAPCKVNWTAPKRESQCPSCGMTHVKVKL